MKCSFCQQKCRLLSLHEKHSTGYELHIECNLYRCLFCQEKYSLDDVIFLVKKENFFIQFWKQPSIIDIHFRKDTRKATFPHDYVRKRFTYIRSEKLIYFEHYNFITKIHNLKIEVDNPNYTPQDFKQKIDTIELLL